MSHVKPKDTALIMLVGPLIDPTDFKTLETAIAYNDTNISVSLVEETDDGTTVTAVTPTTSGDNDWTHVAKGKYKLEVTAAQNNTEGKLYFLVTADAILPAESDHYTIVDTANSAKLDTILTATTAADGIYADVQNWRGDQVNTLTSGRVDAVVGALASGIATSIADAIMDEQYVVQGTVTSATSTTVKLDSGASDSDDAYNGANGQHIIVIWGNTGARQFRYITDYVGSTETATVDSAFTTTPDSTSTYGIIKVSNA
jgi:hypothetical protein